MISREWVHWIQNLVFFLPEIEDDIGANNVHPKQQALLHGVEWVVEDRLVEQIHHIRNKQTKICEEKDQFKGIVVNHITVVEEAPKEQKCNKKSELSFKLQSYIGAKHDDH